MVEHFCPWHYEKRFPKDVDSLKCKYLNSSKVRLAHVSYSVMCVSVCFCVCVSLSVMSDSL